MKKYYSVGINLTFLVRYVKKKVTRDFFVPIAAGKLPMRPPRHIDVAPLPTRQPAPFSH